jgi:hypothetical protein
MKKTSSTMLLVRLPGTCTAQHSTVTQHSIAQHSSAAMQHHLTEATHRCKASCPVGVWLHVLLSSQV